MNQVTIAEAAKNLNVRPQKIYKWIRGGKLTGKKVGKKTCVDLDTATKVLEEELKHPQTKGGRHLNWQALTDFLENKSSSEGEDWDNKIHLEIDSIRKMVEAPKAKLGMLHYWDPYRAQAKFGNQGPGLKAIRAAGFELARIDLDNVPGFDLLGAVNIVVRKK